MIVSSASLAAANGASLAIIRPTDTRFAYKKKTDSAIESETRAYRDASRQAGFLDKDLAEFKPSSYRFAFFPFEIVMESTHGSAETGKLTPRF